MIASRSLNELQEPVRKRVNAFIRAAKAQGIDLLVTSTYRDIEAQNALYAQGRTAPGQVVTNAKGGESMHNYRCAVDVVPLIAGKCCWSDEALWRRIGQLGKAAGLEWAGDWKSFVETPHFQYTGGLSLEQLRTGRVIV